MSDFRRGAIFSVLLGTLAWPLPSLGYVRSTTDLSGVPLFWESSNCLYMRVNSKGSDDIKDNSAVIAAKRAMNNWQTSFQGCSYLRFHVLSDSPNALAGVNQQGGANENVITWVEKDWEDDVHAAAIATVSYVNKPGSPQDGRILDADIELNGVSMHFSTTGAPDRTDVENTVTHELGHVLGLAHSPDPESTMYAEAVPGETKKRDLTADDIQGICNIYPISKDPGECSPVTYGSDSGCSVGGAPRGGAGWLALLGVLLVLRRRGTTSPRARLDPLHRGGYLLKMNRIALVLLLLVSLAAPARATVVLELDLPQLIGRADAIVLGKAVRSESRWSDDGRHIVTDTTFEVEEAVKGEPSARTVVVRRLGGTVGEIGMLVNGMPEFQAGKRYLVFSELRRGHRYVVGMKQGAFHVDKDEAGRHVVQARMEGLTLARKTAAGLQMLEPQQAGPKLLGDFLKQIRETIALCTKEKQRCQTSE